MDNLELVSVVKRLPEGICPCCGANLNYTTLEVTTGVLEKNGMSNSNEVLLENCVVDCQRCGYTSTAVQIGLKIIPVDRIVETDINWDKKYLEENTLIHGQKGKNPFYKKDKE